MSEKTFDFTGLSSLTRVITRSDVSPLKLNKGEDGDAHFRLSQAAFVKLGLDANSLKTMTSKDGKKVYIITCPGNSGEFLKSIQNKASKTGTFKHNELAGALEAAGLTGTDFDLNKVGESDGQVAYEIVAIIAASEVEEGESTLHGEGTEDSSKRKSRKASPTTA